MFSIFYLQLQLMIVYFLKHGTETGFYRESPIWLIFQGKILATKAFVIPKRVVFVRFLVNLGKNPPSQMDRPMMVNIM